MRGMFALTGMLAGTGMLGACAGGDGPPAGGTGSGGTLGELRFAVVGDTRPPFPDETSAYPTPIITRIYQDLVAESPAPAFAIGTGDYIFASTGGTQQQPQLDLYMGARAAFAGTFYPAMGNHECTGATNGNCASAPTKNMTAFAATMLAPIGVTRPYYTETFAATDTSWTAKFVFIACNAWDAAQASWLDAELSKPTTYSFVVRHESAGAVSGTPCPASETTIKAHPLTLRLVGHSHYYSHVAASQEIIVGNGGAPLTSGTNYGYVIIARNASGTLTVTAYDYLTHATLDTFDLQASGAPG